MTRFVQVLVAATLVVVVLVTIGILYVRKTGLVARAVPGDLESRMARSIRSFAVPPAVRAKTNPVAASDEVLAEARQHYADHCAVCHGANGGGDTDMGRGLWPRAPDMRLPPTQNLSDGELFWIIENGIRFTGMPGWGTGTAEGEQATWHLVHLIRRFPNLTEEDAVEIEKMMPRSPAEIRQDIDAERFLQGLDPLP
jgi:mono/diheme cytochrome c family protein